jgi:hypothetical protein
MKKIVLDLNVFSISVVLYIEIHSVHSKEEGILPNSPRCVEWKMRVFRSAKPLNVLSLDAQEEPLNAKPFFKFRRGEKGFLGKISNLQSIVLNTEVLVRNNQGCI